jgi:hypothetical protein
VSLLTKTVDAALWLLGAIALGAVLYLDYLPLTLP